MRSEHWLYTIPLRLRSLFRRRRADQELDIELRDHIACKTADYVGKGMSPQEARRAALIELGGIEQAKEECRDTRRVRWLQDLLQDLRFGLRMLRKSPGFTAVAILTLALGIGANTAIFSLIDSILLKTLPVANPHELVLFSDLPEGGADSGMQSGQWHFFSSDNYAYFRDHNESFKDFCSFQSGWNDLKIRLPRTAGRPDLAHGRLVSGNFFSFLGLSAAAGRLFVASDDLPGSAPSVVLSHTYWTRKFHHDLSVIGKTLELNGVAFTIVGVAPRTFSGVKYDHPDLWMPLAFQPQIMATNPYANDPQEYWLDIMSRLKSGISLRQANIEVNGQLKRILATQAHHETPQQIANSYIELAPGAYGISWVRTTYEETLKILAGIVGIVLLIACANVANLLLSRSSAREQEISIRLAVGASRGRLVRQLLTESVLLAFLGGASGILLARWGVQLLASLIASHATAKNAINLPVLLFTAIVCMLAGILFGLVPALRASRVDLASQVKGSARSRLHFGFTNGLVIFQIAASVVLLVGAGLFLRTLQRLADQVLGFDANHTIVARINPEAAGYNPADTPALYQALIDRVEAMPGVISATVSNDEPFSGSSWSSNFTIEGLPPRPAREMMVRKELVGPNYFETKGIPILLGRDIGPQDRPGTPLVTVINQTMAQEYFRGVHPIGRRFSLGAPFNPQEAMTIVGVAADARYYSLRDPVPPMEFCAALQLPDANSHNASFAGALELRVRGNPDPVARDIRAAIAQVSSSLPVGRVTVLEQEVNDSLSQNRSDAELSSAFGMIALVLACIGVYGTMAYRVSRRTREFGIRIALGAGCSDVLRLIMRECLFLAAAGIVIGVPAALASTRLIASQLFEVRSSDPLTFVVVTILLMLVALAACYIPARRAMKVDPMVALGYE